MGNQLDKKDRKKVKFIQVVLLETLETLTISSFQKSLKKRGQKRAQNGAKINFEYNSFRK